MSVNAELDESGKRIIINAEWRYKELCKSLPGSKWDTKTQIWSAPTSWATCLALRSTFKDDLVIGPRLSEWATHELTTRITPANALRDLETLDEGNEDLFPHQRAGVKFLSVARRALLADEPGLGKTAQAIRALKQIQDNGEDVFPALIVCPNTLKKNWKREFERWWPGVDVEVIKGSATQRRKVFEEEADVYVINWESLRSHSRLSSYGSIALARCVACGGHDDKVSENRCEVHERELNRIDFKAVVADECFVEGTPVSTPYGDKPINQLVPGDQIWGYDHNENKVVLSTVLDTMYRNSGTIVTKWGATPNHPFYVKGEGYRPLGDLIEGDELYAIDYQAMQDVPPRVRVRRITDNEQTKNVLLEDMFSGSKWQESVLEDPSKKNHGTEKELRMVQKSVSASVQKETIKILQQVVRPALERLATGSTRKSCSSDVQAYDGSRQQASPSSASARQIRQKSVQVHGSTSPFSEREAWMAESSVWHEHKQTENFSRSEDVVRKTTTARNRVVGAFQFSGEHRNYVRVLGYWISRNKAGGGGGRWSSSLGWQKSCGCSPHGETHAFGLDSHPLLELRSPQRYEQVCRDNSREDETVVYSITTSTGNYFANDVLVRNCHRSKEPKSKQSRALWAATGDADIRFALTGTPISNTVLDLWPILHWLSPEEWPSKGRWIDRMVNTMLNAFGGMMVLGIKPHMEQEFYATINPRMRRMLKKVVLPWLPDMMFERRDIEMSTKQKKAYEQMRDTMIAELESMSSSDIVTAPSALTQTIRLLQFASSYAEMAVNEETGEIKTVLAEPSSKVDSLMDDIKNGDFGNDSVAVCAVSRQLIDLLSAALTKEKIPHGLITGAQDEDERQQAVDDFQSGRIKWILFTAQAGGVGITLTAARRLVMLQRPWSLVDHKQALDRVHRIGSEIHDSIIITDYVTEGTIEERVLQVLETKADNFEQIVKDKDKLLSLLKDDKAGKL